MTSKESKHTPGPWEVTDRGAIVRKDSWPSDVVVHTDNGESVISSSANARLIASAPELLAVCYYVLESLDVGGEQSRAFFAEIFRLKEAIAKAKGEP